MHIVAIRNDQLHKAERLRFNLSRTSPRWLVAALPITDDVAIRRPKSLNSTFDQYGEVHR